MGKPCPIQYYLAHRYSSERLFKIGRFPLRSSRAHPPKLHSEDRSNGVFRNCINVRSESYYAVKNHQLSLTMVYPNKGLIGIFCSISAIEVSTAIVTPVRPTPAEQ